VEIVAIGMSVSIGVATLSQQDTSIDDVLRCADAGAKCAKRNKVAADDGGAPIGAGARARPVRGKRFGASPARQGLRHGDIRRLRFGR
jgi:GGDEF domain-containing protein